MLYCSVNAKLFLSHKIQEFSCANSQDLIFAFTFKLQGFFPSAQAIESG